MSNHSLVVELREVTKKFGETVVLDNITMNIKRNEFITLLGPSGCGKTTTLRLIGGFDKPTSGDIIFESKSILNLPPYKRKLNTVFQKYALFPHMNVEENIAFGLNVQKKSKDYIASKVKEMLRLVNLDGFEKRPVSSLSGGQQQRIAIARALVNEPTVLLFDEPLGALDMKLRKEMQLELKNMQKKLGITFVYVTHDQEEALTMSDTIVVMNNGVIQQIGRPEDVYNEPVNAFVAQFIGESNMLPGIMKSDFSVEFMGVSFPCVDSGFGNEAPVGVVIRPEDIDIVPAEQGMLRGRVTNVTFKGVHYEMLVLGESGYTWKIHSTDMSPQGAEVGLLIGPNEIHIMRRAED